MVTTTKTAEGGMVAQIELLENQQDINAEYDRIFDRFRELKLEIKPKVVDEEIKREDYFRSFRTKVLLSWVVCNITMIAGLTHPVTMEIFETMGKERGVFGFNPYLSFIFYSVAFIAAVRFAGSFMYLVQRMIYGEFQ